MSLLKRFFDYFRKRKRPGEEDTKRHADDSKGIAQDRVRPPSLANRGSRIEPRQSATGAEKLKRLKRKAHRKHMRRGKR